MVYVKNLCKHKCVQIGSVGGSRKIKFLVQCVGGNLNLLQ